ncbi:hypothetical protein HM1_2412 [Heliomicrobium modesticaldum Ice1]|uniref:Uncharacterized protein n=1 Tax=Heliobacterium modesticaldum (strain ATCC 51547 / Ice1) TaxID=498761 RepID=B0TIM1_HELMI|nr:hypothetical protein [Heliomicrobium modesticaldum]ABZ84962.1 hypothetical protein HM1_2412 [Heliomicrobium modesticaldum Ice1]
MRHFRVDLRLEEGNPREAQLIWWLEQLRDPAAVIRQILLGNGVPPWAAQPCPALFSSPSAPPLTLPTSSIEESETGIFVEKELEKAESRLVGLSELDGANEEDLDPETIKKGLQNVFG